MAFTVTGVLPPDVDPTRRVRSVTWSRGKLTGDGVVLYQLAKSGHAAAVCRVGCPAPESPWCVYLALTILLERHAISGANPRAARCPR